LSGTMLTPSRSRSVAAKSLLALALAFGCAASGAASSLVIQVPAEDLDAEVFVDGSYMGQVRALGAPDRRVRLTPGAHRVEVRKPGRFPVQRTVQVDRDAASETVVQVELLEDPE
jgi:hypothetical protein